MKLRKRVCISTVMAVLLAGAVVNPGVAQKRQMSIEEFTDVMLELAIIVDAFPVQANDPRLDASGEFRGLEDRVRAMTEEELGILLDSFEDASAFAHAVRSVTLDLQSRLPQGPRAPATKGVTGINDVPFVAPLNPQAAFPPAYPSGGSYNLFTATLGGLGYLVDTNGDGMLNDERCDPNPIADLTIASEALTFASIIAQGGCDTLVVIVGEGSNLPACIAAAVANTAIAAVEIPIAQCAFQCALVDGAEIEAAFENTKIIIDGLTCREPVAPRRGHGCNGTDDTCDAGHLIDECAEDGWPPDLHIDAAVTTPWYRSFADAAAAVADASQGVDDCNGVTLSTPALGGVCGNVSASVTATDSCGNSTTTTATVQVDGEAPSFVIDPAVANSCVADVATGEQAVLAATVLSDDCTPLSELDFRLDSTVTECSLRVRQEAIDHAGNRSTAAVTVRADAERPVVEIERLELGFRGEVLGFQTPVCYATVEEAEAAVLQVTRFQDNCSAAEDVTRSVSSSGDQCSLQVTSQGVDECGNTNSDMVTVRVDATVPTVTAAVTIPELTPSNHDMIDVGFSFTATDDCNGALTVVVTVTSDEPTASAPGAGQTTPAPDAEILRDLNGEVQGIRLRAERSTVGDGRVYEITVTATDPCGNVGSASAQVAVRVNPGQPAVDSGQFYDATAVN